MQKRPTFFKEPTSRSHPIVHTSSTFQSAYRPDIWEFLSLSVDQWVYLQIPAAEITHSQKLDRSYIYYMERNIEPIFENFCPWA